jgi:hypothetical protein
MCIRRFLLKSCLVVSVILVAQSILRSIASMVTTPEDLSAIARAPPDEALRDSKTMHMALPAVGTHSHSSEHQGVPEEISNAPIVDNSCPEGSPVAHGQHQLQQNTESHQRGEGASHVPEYSRAPSTSSQDRLGLTLSDWKTTQRIEDEGFQPKTSQITNQAVGGNICNQTRLASQGKIS